MEGSLVPFVYEQKPENAAGPVQRLGVLVSRRPGEGRDPYAAAVVLRKPGVTNSSCNHSLWLWVPASAGTTERAQPLTRSGCIFGLLFVYERN